MSIDLVTTFGENEKYLTVASNSEQVIILYYIYIILCQYI